MDGFPTGGYSAMVVAADSSSWRRRDGRKRLTLIARSAAETRRCCQKDFVMGAVPQ